MTASVIVGIVLGVIVLITFIIFLFVAKKAAPYEDGRSQNTVRNSTPNRKKSLSWWKTAVRILATSAVISLSLFVFIFVRGLLRPGTKMVGSADGDLIAMGSTVPGVIPKSADPEVVKLAQKKFKDYPFLFAVAIRESGLRQFENDSGGNPDHSQPLRARLKDGSVGSAIGVMQIKGDLHSDFCTSHGWDIKTIEGNLDCAIVIYESDEKGRGPDAWNPQLGGLLEFDEVAEHGIFTKPLKVPRIARGAYTFGNKVEVRVNGHSDKEPLIAGPGIRMEHGNIVKTLEFRATETDTATGHFIYAYPPFLSAKNQ